MYWDYGPSFVLPGETITSKRFRLILTPDQARRLADTCFRPRSQQVSGNFLWWSSVDDLREDPTAGDALREMFLSAIDEAGDQEQTIRRTLVFLHPIGWASAVTEDSDVYYLMVDTDLEHFFPNRHIRAYRVRATSYETLPAPLTNLLTVVFTVRMGAEGYPLVFLQTLYPGEDIGPLRPTGNSRTLRGVVFWDWNAPGQDPGHSYWDDGGPEIPQMVDCIVPSM